MESGAIGKYIPLSARSRERACPVLRYGGWGEGDVRSPFILYLPLSPANGETPYPNLSPANGETPYPNLSPANGETPYPNLSPTGGETQRGGLSAIQLTDPDQQRT